MTIYEIKSTDPSPPGLFPFIVYGSLCSASLTSTCFAWSRYDMVRIEEVNAGISKGLCSHELALYFTFSPCCCPLTCRKWLSWLMLPADRGQTSGRKCCLPHSARKVMGLYHTCLIADVLPGTTRVPTEDQQGQVSQHYKQHTGGLKEARANSCP